jgi:hypothetical protein
LPGQGRTEHAQREKGHVEHAVKDPGNHLALLLVNHVTYTTFEVFSNSLFFNSQVLLAVGKRWAVHHDWCGASYPNRIGRKSLCEPWCCFLPLLRVAIL